MTTSGKKAQKATSHYYKPLNVVVERGSRAERIERRTAGLPGGIKRVPADLANGFTPTPRQDLVFHGGKTIRSLTYTNLYVGGDAAWVANDRTNIDHALSAAMTDAHLDNVVRQYFNNEALTTAFHPSQILPGSPPPKFSAGDVTALVKQLFGGGKLSGFDLTTNVFNFMLPRGTVLTTDTKRSAERIAKPAAAAKRKNPIRPEATESSLQGLGGYHGSVHIKTPKATIYYAVGVFSEGDNGIVAFDQSWKNVVATFYHELQEARTDADVDDAIKAGNSPRGAKFLGWVSQSGDEIGDFPMSEAGAELGKVLREVPLAKGGGKVPIQFMYSNFVHGPEGPIPNPHPQPASRTFTTVR
jgi:hypothetical protein